VIDLEHGPLADIRVNPEGALAVYPDGHIERFGRTEGLEPAIFCVAGNLLRPLETCRNAVEAKGALEHLLRSAPK
jgi:hypothetical protein